MFNIMAPKMNSELDSTLTTINGLTWLPWIGDQYWNVDHENRMFIVGESHYHKNTPNDVESVKSPTFTREVIADSGIDRNYYDIKMFPNFHRAIFGNDIFNAEGFWNLVSFYNFIQRPMATTQGRPSNIDFFNGWKVFFEIVKVLKPKTCLFIGTTAANSLTNAIQGTDFSTDGVKWDEYISNAYAKSATIKDKDNNEIKIIFIRHTSQMFSWSQWNDYLIRTIPNELAWLKSKL
jgi:hypothetical protein